MSDDFTPKLGRPGDRGRGAAKRYGARVKRAAKRLVRPKRNHKFSGERIGRGSAAARMAQLRSHPFAKFRMRRVIVKVHIARAGKGIGTAAFRAHVKYIQRDGVDRHNHDGENGRGVLYERDSERMDDKRFLERSGDDRHQFRIILSPEDADQLSDLKAYAREVMARAEKDLGTRLEWVAVDHHNTGHPHTHIVIRGKDENGGDLVIAKDYLTRGLRMRAQEVALELLGPRRDLEIARTNAHETEADRMTGIDKRLHAMTRDGVIEIGGASGGHGRFERTLALRRLAYLERQGFAVKTGAGEWRIAAGWEDRLKELALKNDIIRSIAAAAGNEAAARGVSVFGEGAASPEKIVGRVIANTPADELRDTRFLLVDGADGKIWRVGLGRLEPGAMPPQGAIIEVRAALKKPRQSDRIIAHIAEINHGVYSAGLHAADDPSASTAYIEAHKRRLEALRRAGLVERAADGSWRVGKDYLEKAARYESSRVGNATLTVKSWIDLDAQVHRPAPTWLDDQDAHDFQDKGFGAEIGAAKARRAAYLKGKGLWAEDADGLDPALHSHLGESELNSAAELEANRTGKIYRAISVGARFSGIYEKPLNLAQGRFALMAQAREFTLVPWRAELERWRGQMLTIKRTGAGIEWTVGQSRGISR